MTNIEADDGEDVLDEDANLRTPDSATVTIIGPGVSITRHVDEATMSSIIPLLFGARPPVQERDVQPPSQSDRLRPALQDPELTLGEFLTETGARTFAQKICAAGYYLIHSEGHESFDREGIRSALVAAHEDLPGNFHRDFTAAAASKLIAAKPGDGGKYFVTTTGRRAVDSHFQEIPKQRRTPKRRKPGTSSGNGAPE